MPAGLPPPKVSSAYSAGPQHQLFSLSLNSIYRQDATSAASDFMRVEGVPVRLRAAGWGRRGHGLSWITWPAQYGAPIRRVHAGLEHLSCPISTHRPHPTPTPRVCSLPTRCPPAAKATHPSATYRTAPSSTRASPLTAAAAGRTSRCGHNEQRARVHCGRSCAHGLGGACRGCRLHLFAFFCAAPSPAAPPRRRARTARTNLAPSTPPHAPPTPRRPPNSTAPSATAAAAPTSATSTCTARHPGSSAACSSPVSTPTLRRRACWSAPATLPRRASGWRTATGG
jgi:hypothetical protein